MSRKREHKREQNRALAQQLGVHAGDVPEDLLAHPRVCEPTLDVELAVQRSARGLLKPAGPFALHLLLVVIDSAGVRMARQQRLHAVAARVPGPAVLAPRVVTDATRVRYTRPGWFRLVCVLTAGATEAQGDAISAALADAPALRLHASAPGAQSAPAWVLAHDVARATGPQPVELAAWRDALSDGTVLRAAVLATFPAAHRVDQTLALPLVDARAKLEAALTVRVRL